MTRQPHDQFAKSLLSEFLAPYGSAVVNMEVSDEPRFVDLYFEPARDPSPDLGLLGQIARIPCFLEPFRNPVTVEDIQSCLLNHELVTGLSQMERRDS